VIFGIFIYILEVEMDIENLSLLLTFTIPVVIMVNAYKGLLYGATFAIIVAIVSSYSVYLGVGVFSSNSLLDNIININFFILTHISMVLISGALFEERKQTEYLLQMKVDTELERNKEQQLLMFQQSRLAQMGEMIAMIAHQWRQPLNTLSLVNQILVSKYKRGKLDDEVIDTFSHKSKKLITHMSTTIDDFRNFFRSDKEKKRFCINESIDKVLSMTASMIEIDNISIAFDTPQLYYTYGYPNEFSQAILNLVNNAKDALIESTSKNKQIHISIEEKEALIYIHIDDNAGGVPEEIIDKIFDPYFSTKENKNGTGLGLYMVKMIIIDHLHANITVSNTKEGARFTISVSRSA
jgi:signal transduction histidine kinase